MATLYEIDIAILECIDMETGEIVDEEKLDALQLQRDTKLENVALWIKNLQADAAAFKAEKDNFAKREKVANNKIESLKSYLSYALNGEKFETAKCKVSFRKSKQLVIADGAIIPHQFLKPKDPDIDRKELKKQVEDGLEIEGVSIITNNNIQIG